MDLILLLGSSSTSETTSATGGNETDLLTGRGTTTSGRSVTNVLMVTTTMRMLDGIHRNTSNLRPAVSLDLVLVVSVTSLEKRLIKTTTTSNNTDHSTASGRNGLLDTRRKLDAGLVVITVGDDGGVVTRSTSEHTTVSSLALNVADGKLGLVTAVNKLSSVHALSSNEEFLLELVL